MSAASPKVQDKAQEPSMEEILASIRRIIADDQATKPEAEPALPEPHNDDVLDLADIAQPVRRPAPPILQAPEPEPPPRASAPQAAPPQPAPLLDMPEIDFADEVIDFAEPEPEPEPVFAPPPPPARKPPERLQAAIEQEAVQRLVSGSTDESVGRAFQLLSHTVLSHNARTVEDLVIDMLRPMLKDWLDDNLPSMVERLVKAEIERVARGR